MFRYEIEIANRPRPDETLEDSLPLPQFSEVQSELRTKEVGRLLGVTEFLRTFLKAMPPDVQTELGALSTAEKKRSSLTFRDLERYVIRRQIHDEDGSFGLLRVLACLMVTLLEITVDPPGSSGKANCKVKSLFEIDLYDLPMEANTASEITRMYLDLMGYLNSLPLLITPLLL